MKNALRTIGISCLLTMSPSVFAVSIDDLKPADGDSVKLSGFTVTMDISGLPKDYSYSILIFLEVWDGAAFQWNSDGAAHPAGHYDGTNIKYIVPDVYFARDEPPPSDLHVVAKVGHLVNMAHQGSYPAAVGDQIRVTTFIYGYAGAQWIQDQKSALLTVK